MSSSRLATWRAEMKLISRPPGPLKLRTGIGSLSLRPIQRQPAPVGLPSGPSSGPISISTEPRSTLSAGGATVSVMSGFYRLACYAARHQIGDTRWRERQATRFPWLHLRRVPSGLQPGRDRSRRPGSLPVRLSRTRRARGRRTLSVQYRASLMSVPLLNPLDARFRAIEERLSAIERELVAIKATLTEMDKRIPSAWLIVGLILPLYGLIVLGFGGLFWTTVHR